MEYSYFAGGNSGKGFYDCFEHLIPEGEKKERVIILKGGPGVGKSTLMKKVAAAAGKKKEETELFWCSGDPESLDAVRIIRGGILVLDGTAPHSKDPVYPGAVEETMNLGEQINREKIRSRREDIVRLVKENGEQYRRAYALLSAATMLANERYREVEACLDREKLNRLKKEMTGRAEVREEQKQGERRLFLDAITWKGKVSYAPYALQAHKSFGFTGENADVLLDCLFSEWQGGRFERFLQPLVPERTAHVYLPEAMLFVTAARFETEEAEETDQFLTKKPHADVLRYRREEERLVGLAVKRLEACKKIHDELEMIYKECVDFEKITERTEELLHTLGF